MRSGADFTGGWAAHGQAWDPLVDAVWAAYRRPTG